MHSPKSNTPVELAVEDLSALSDNTAGSCAISRKASGEPAQRAMAREHERILQPDDLSEQLPKVLPSIAQHASRHGIAPLKRYGQNFLFDGSLCDKIVRASELEKGRDVLEIGPGTAGLTRAILACNPKSLTVIETDKRCIPLLEEIQNLYPQLKIIEGDALAFSVKEFHAASQLKDKLLIISNLPYQIGTELVIQWIKAITADNNLIESMTLMLQKEVVDRMRASEGNKSYGRLSVICQLACKVTKCFDVGPEAFYPAPKVHSSIVRLTPHKEALVIDLKLLNQVELITKLAFGGRRKMIKSSLSGLGANLISWLAKLGINESSRAENLSPQDYLALAKLSIM